MPKQTIVANVPLDQQFEQIIRRKQVGILQGGQDGLYQIGLEVQAKAQRMMIPEHIKDNIEVRKNPAQKEDRQVSVDVFVDLNKAPDARAWEFGSGLHSTRGAKSTYVIAARNAPYLIFTWWKKNNPPTTYQHPEKNPEGMKLKYVNHPGIRPKHYLRNSLNMLLGKVGNIVRGSIRTRVRGGIGKM